MVYRAPLGVLCFAVAACTLGQITASSATGTLSGFIDTTGLFISQSSYDGWIGHSASDPDTYINAMGIAGGASWDPDIDFYAASGGFSYFEPGVGYGNYAFGTAISGDTNWYVGGLASRWGQVYDTAPGLYDFTVDIYGGGDGAAMDLLAQIQYSFEVADRLDVTAIGSASPGQIHRGETTSVTMTVTNGMTGRSFFSTTWFYSGGGMVQGSEPLTHVSWDGDWFDKEITAGNSRTDGHTTWRAEATNTNGVYEGQMGVVGGLHPGDWHWLSMSGTIPTVELVPEPGSLLVLALGGLALLRRKR